MKNIKYLLVGVFFGIVIVKTEVISWFRVQEMFRFQAFHMYGVMGMAVLIGVVSVAIIKKLQLRSLSGEAINIPDKSFHYGQVYGGLLFGCGWALTGACPGPLYAHLGAGNGVMVVALLSAIGGTWVYGFLHERLPH